MQDMWLWPSTQTTSGTVPCLASQASTTSASAVWMVAHYIDSGVEDYSVEAAMSKVFTDMMRETTPPTNRAIAFRNAQTLNMSMATLTAIPCWIRWVTEKVLTVMSTSRNTL